MMTGSDQGRPGARQDESASWQEPGAAAKTGAAAWPVRHLPAALPRDNGRSDWPHHASPTPAAKGHTRLPRADEQPAHVGTRRRRSLFATVARWCPRAPPAPYRRLRRRGPLHGARDFFCPRQPRPFGRAPTRSARNLYRIRRPAAVTKPEARAPSAAGERAGFNASPQRDTGANDWPTARQAHLETVRWAHGSPPVGLRTMRSGLAGKGETARPDRTSMSHPMNEQRTVHGTGGTTSDHPHSPGRPLPRQRPGAAARHAGTRSAEHP